MTRKQKKHLARIIAAAVLLALVWFVLPLEGIWQLLAYCVPYFIVGWDVLWGAIRKILHGDLMDEEFLMSVCHHRRLCTGRLPGSRCRYAVLSDR